MKRQRDCLVCGSWAEPVFDKHWGFQAPGCFDIYECAQCDTSFADPLKVDPAIYDLIYRNAGRVSGYERYERYRDLIKRSQDPLTVLCEQEDVYWAIREAVHSMERKLQRPMKILEVGSGFGYLTYGLRRAGYDCIGIDVSEEAVRVAKREFGDFFRVGDLGGLAVSGGDKFDLILATELIEHVPDPVAIVKNAASLLNPSGGVLVTTPNKDLYPTKYVWNTDPPPVHLWWFSKTSFRFMGWKLGMRVSFSDFSAYYGQNRTVSRVPSKPQTFSENGEICFRDSFAKTLARRAVSNTPWLFRPMAKTLIGLLAIGKIREQLFQESLSLCVLLETKEN